jgi:NitT/TauT family transport system substrate-binding protein
MNFRNLVLLVACSLAVATLARGQDAKPLPSRETLKVGVPAHLKQNAAIILAKELGEFEKENISIEYTIQRPSDGLVLLSTNRIDVLSSQGSAAFFNAVAGGSEIKMAYPSGYWAPEGKTGFWVSKTFLNGRKYSPELLKGQTIASTAGSGTLISQYVEFELNKVGLDQRAVSWKTMGIGDILIALENGAINFGVLIDPFTEKADPSRVEFAFAGGQPESGVIGAYFFGPKLLKERRDIGEAFVRALVRTVRTHLSGDITKNAKVIEVLSKQLQVPAEQLRKESGIIFGDRVQFGKDMAATLQKTYSLTPGILSYATPLTDAQVIDRSFRDKAEAKPE